LLIQNNNENKCGILTSSYLHQLIERFLNFLSKALRLYCFAPLSREDTNFENGYQIQSLHFLKMEAAQLLMALTSPITKQNHSYTCGSQFKNPWHLAAAEQMNCEQ
jgi:heme oxygenase